MIQTRLDPHIAAQVADGLPEDEALCQQVWECLESEDVAEATLRALEVLAELAQRHNPHLAITVRVGPADRDHTPHVAVQPS